jgi:hypothetical protein
MDWIPKITDLAKVPTKVFAVIALTTGSALFLPTPILKRLSMDSIPAPWGVIVGIAFLISAAMVVVNCIGWFVRRRRSIQRSDVQSLEMVAKLGNLDAEEQAILREFVVFRRSTLGLPVDNPTVAGLRASGVIRLVGTMGKGSRFGVFFSRSSFLAKLMPLFRTKSWACHRNS